MVGALRDWLRGRAAGGAAPDPEHPDSWLSLDVIRAQVTAQLDAQAKTWDEVDGRLRLILGFIGIVFAVVAGFLRASSPAGVSAAGPLPFAVGALAIGAVGVYLTAGIIVAWVYWPTTFDRPPAPAALRDLYLTRDPRETTLAVLDSMIEAYSKNERVLARRTRAFKVAFVLTGAATALLGAATIIQLALQTTAGPA